ncbi:MAG: molybdopterin-dependent oxidoreductase [Chloroflexi bacterium]|nr:molybdopterin-dependent oxidoreductase [Chloroflexota bacterium]
MSVTPIQNKQKKKYDKLLWQATACVLCGTNCGLEVKVDGRHIVKVRGDKNNPVSAGYLCQKAARIDYYQNHLRRLKNPLKKQPDGSFAQIDWNTAVREISDKLVHLRDTHGGHSIAYYGGGGQTNHMPGAHATSFRAAIGTPYIYSSLAQEKTGDFWVNGKLFGRQTCHLTERIHHADYAILIGTNPFQSHGIPQARRILRDFAKDPNRTLVVIDPRRTKTAELADIHIPIKPGTDAFLMTAILAIIVQEGLEDKDFIANHTVGFETLRELLLAIDVTDYCQRAEVDTAVVFEVARGFAAAKAGCTRHDLGVEMSLHSTLNTYLEKLLFLITGNFGKEGSNNLHTQLLPVIAHSKEPEQGGIRTKVTGMKEISKIFPPNILPLEVNTDHPERLRGLFIDGSNPLQSAADTQAYVEAFSNLDLVVVIDVAMTKTAEMADYILPAQTQYEKWEASFFSWSFPTNYFFLRRPIIEAEGDTLPEPEIYFRLLVAMGAIPETFPELEAAAKKHREQPEKGIFPIAFQKAMQENPAWRKYQSAILYATLGKALPNEAQTAAVLWGSSQFYVGRYEKQVMRAGYEGEGFLLAENLFNAILETETHVPISAHTYDETWELVKHKDGKIHLPIPEMLIEMRELETEKLSHPEYPYILASGERRDYNANQIMRDPDWRRNDPNGGLRIHPEDAAALGIGEGQQVYCESERGGLEVVAIMDDRQRRGFVSLPHGYGMTYPDLQTEEMVQHGPRLNVMTASSYSDPLAKTPYHKYIPVRLQPLPIAAD